MTDWRSGQPRAKQKAEPAAVAWPRSSRIGGVAVAEPRRIAMPRGADPLLGVARAAPGARHGRQSDDLTIGSAFGDERRHVDFERRGRPALGAHRSFDTGWRSRGTSRTDHGGRRAACRGCRARPTAWGASVFGMGAVSGDTTRN